MAGLCDGGNEPPGSLKARSESYPAFAHIGLRENPGRNLNQVTCPDRESNPGHLVSRLDALTVQMLLGRVETGRSGNNPSERIPNLSAEQSDGITVFRISTITSLMLHRCRTGAINLQRWCQSPSAAISESDWFLYRAGISRRMTSCTVVSWRCVLL
ncbi:hypothetical protein ANN_19741 [Periplaneta americana]|uniref:Uncharacterized protein n=1 Tax=Periplaneta americana TaxID=6978 RepID=A0ABQ8SBD8_PERAM|nr:hypothetical protein ANN_19741 [Periplaneta americana]